MTVLPLPSRDTGDLAEVSARLTAGTAGLARDTRNFARRMARLHTAVERRLAAAQTPMPRAAAGTAVGADGASPAG
jgi:hypothetical protein